MDPIGKTTRFRKQRHAIYVNRYMLKTMTNVMQYIFGASSQSKERKDDDDGRSSSDKMYSESGEELNNMMMAMGEEGLIHDGDDESGEMNPIQAFLHDLEDNYVFPHDELHQFYCTTSNAYIYELLSAGNKIPEQVDTFISRFLAYLLPSPSEQNLKDAIDIGTYAQTCDRITFPRITCDAYAHYAQCLDGDQCSTYLVDSRLDFVYGYVMQKAIVDTLYAQCSVMLKKIAISDPTTHITVNTRLHCIEQGLQDYRECADRRYVHCPIDESGTEFHTSTETGSRSCARCHVIYTKRSSAFFQYRYKIIKEQAILSYPDDTLEVETLPFQQVLMLCGQTSSFTKKHCAMETDAQTFVVSTEDAHDWISVSSAFLLIGMHTTSSNSISVLEEL